MTKHSYFPYTSTYSSMRHNTNKKTQHPSQPLTQTYNILQHSKAKKNTMFNNGRYTTNIPTDPYLTRCNACPNQDKYIILTQIIFRQSQRQITSITTMLTMYHSHTQHTSSLQLHPHAHHIAPIDLWTDPAGETALLARWTVRNWLVDHKREDRTPGPTSKGHGSG